MTSSAPAKINLSLKITQKRPDGFHELETLVLPLPHLADQLTFQPAPKLTLECPTPGVPTDHGNLVIQAAQLFSQHTSRPTPYHIHLKKNIPHGAGLGGGSSDAATTLLALNTLTQTNLPRTELSELAAQLGSDVPLFLAQSPCWCRGRGELITPVSLSWHAPILLFKPAFDIPTPWAYAHWQNSQEIPSISYQTQTLGPLQLHNDLERPVFQKHRFLAELKQFLLEQPETTAALMSGSGSTVFAILQHPAQAPALIQRTLETLDPTLWYHFAP